MMNNQDIARYSYEHDPEILSYGSNSNYTEIQFLTKPQQFFHIYALSTKIESGYRPAPILKWNYCYQHGGESLEIKACIEYKGAETEWYEAPFMNTSNGRVCLGGTDFKAEDLFSNVNLLKKAVMTGFFASAFTHIGKRCSKSNFIKLQQKLLNANEYPISELIRYKDPEYEDDDL